MVYAAPASNMTVGLLPMLDYVNDSIGGFLGLGFLLAFEFIIFIAMLSWGSERALAVVSVAGIVMSTFLSYLGLISDKFIYLFIIMAMVAVAYLYAKSTTE